MSKMLTLPENLDYTLAELLLINREKPDTVREPVKSLKPQARSLRSTRQMLQQRTHGRVLQPGLRGPENQQTAACGLRRQQAQVRACAAFGHTPGKHRNARAAANHTGDVARGRAGVPNLR